jgi:hypothetical protein
MIRTSAVLSGALLSVSVLFGAPLPEQAGTVPIPGGIADGAGKRGYITGEKGGVEAVDLETGKTLWSSAAAQKPLALVGGKLLAQAQEMGKPNQVRVITFDAEGGKVRESEPVVFPDWVVIGLTYGRSFTSRGEVQKGDLYLHWQARAWYAGGARPTPQIEQAARKNADGVARVNLETGKVEMLAKDLGLETEPKLPAALEKITSQQYWTGADWKTKPLVTGSVVAVLTQEGKGDQATLSLRRWELATGKELETLKLMEGKSLWPQVTLEGSHVFVHQALPKEKLPEGDYAWWVFSLATGKQVAKLPYGPMEGAAVLGTKVLIGGADPGAGPPRGPFGAPQPRALRAIELATGKELWKHALEPHRTLPPLP